MIRHQLKVAFRNLFKYKAYSLINLTGLALGIASGILITMYVLDELSYDGFHVNGDRIYRVNTIFTKGGEDSGLETNAWPIGDILRKDFPETEAVLYTRSANLMSELDGKKVREKIGYASPEFFTLFSFPLLKGNTDDQLTKPFTLVISRSMEAKYFKGKDAVGQTMMLNDTLLFQITGVMEDIPTNSHIQLDMLASFATFEKLSPEFSYANGWGNINMRNYILLKLGTNFQEFRKKAENLYHERAGDMLKQWGMEAKVAFEPFTDIYLKTKAGNGLGPLGSITTVYLLIGAGAFVILLACINFINLATARSVLRAREVGVKKTMGSTRAKLIGQFVSESFVITMLAFVISIFVILLFLPVFNSLLGKTYSLVSLLNPTMAGAGIMLVFGIAIFSGYYPALVITAYSPSEILKGKFQSSTRGVQLRRLLVLFQFFVSVGLVSTTLIVFDQLKYMQTRNLGFTSEEIFVINIARTKPVDGNAYQGFYNELKGQSLVKEVSFCNALPAVSGWRGQIAYPEGKSGDDAVDTQYMAVDENYIQTLGLTLVTGRNFDLNRRTDIETGLIINETAVKSFGWETAEKAIGKRITSPSGTPAGEVIGVVKDYHDQGLQNRIVANVMDYNRDDAYLYAVRFGVQDMPLLMEMLGDLWKKYFPENEFNYFFLSETFARQYAREQRLAKVFTVFSITTILIAIIGLFGLVSFLVTSKTKEIGIRKVMGANTWSLTSLLTREFLILILLANMVSIPVVSYFSAQWLEGFAFRTSINPLIFILTACLALILALICIGFETFKAANANPVDSLRHE